MPANELPFTYQELAACAKREAGLRLSVYQKQAGSEPIAPGKQLEIDKMQTIADYFEGLAALPPVQYATGAQRKEIIRLLNHPLITLREKTKMLLAINRIDCERAAMAIVNLREAIELRKNMGEVAA